MSATDRLWLNGFTTASEMLASDPLAIEEVRQALDDDLAAGSRWLVPWLKGLDAAVRTCFGE